MIKIIDGDIFPFENISFTEHFLDSNVDSEDSTTGSCNLTTEAFFAGRTKKGLFLRIQEQFCLERDSLGECVNEGDITDFIPLTQEQWNKIHQEISDYVTYYETYPSQ